MNWMEIRQPKKPYKRKSDILVNPDNPRQRGREKAQSQINEQERFELANAYLTGKR